MVKEFQMTGACPIVVNGYGRVEPDSGNFQCEMEPAQEAFFSLIGAVKVVRDLPDAVHQPKPLDRVDGVVEFEGRTLDAYPASWPRRGSGEGTVEDFVPEG